MVYGKKNQRYVSPTFRSNNLFYGEEQVRANPQEQFYTISNQGSKPLSVGMASGFEKQKCESTNQFAQWQNSFHKSHSNLNLKNFSQVPLGKNQNVELAYKEQFNTRNKLWDSQQNVKNPFKKNKDQDQSKRIEHTIQNTFYPEPKVTVREPDRLHSPQWEQVTHKSQRIQKQISSPQPKSETFLESYSCPDWNFFSPQSDPFRDAFNSKTLSRVRSMDTFNSPDRSFTSKTVLQDAEVGDCFLQTFRGETLKFNHKKQELVRSLKRDKVLSISHNFDRSKRNFALQYAQIYSSGIIDLIGERDPHEAKIQNLRTRMQQTQQIAQKQEHRLRERQTNLDLERSQANLHSFTSSLLSQRQEQEKENTKIDLIQSYQESLNNKYQQKHQELLEKQSARTFIDQQVHAARRISSYKGQIKQHQQTVCQYRPITQRLARVVPDNSWTSPERDYWGGASNASTVSSMGQATKANISKKEFELRKKQMNQKH